MAGSTRFIDRLKKASRLEPVKKEITFSSGETFCIWYTPLTAAQRDRAKKTARSDDPGAFALQLLIQKAMDEDGQPLFAPGDAASLRNDLRDEDLQKLMLAVLGVDEDEDAEEALDMKSPE